MRTSSPTTHRLALGIMALVAGITLAASVATAQPVTSDSRIKTFVYNANEVFTITTHYGYQSNIEFGPKEVIDTISVGDRVGWQIIPAGSRLFIRAMEENARTNMTIVTNFRAYQFDLRSSAADAVFGSEELTYVVRFYYPPQTMSDAAQTAAPYTRAPMTGAFQYTPPAISRAAVVAPVVAPSPAPVMAMPAPAAPTRAAPQQMNYRYTFSGPSDIAPTKIYDDGQTTYFKIRGNQHPNVSIVTAQGDSVAVMSRRTPDGLLAVDAIAPRFSLNQTGRQVIVYNEAGGEVY